MIRNLTFILAIVVSLLIIPACKDPVAVTPEEALSELLENPPGKRNSSLDDDFVLVGRPTYKIRTAPTQVPSHYATVTGNMDSRGTHYRFTFTAFCKNGVWYFDPDEPMLLEQPDDSWSSSDPEYALHHCQMAATWCLGFKR